MLSLAPFLLRRAGEVLRPRAGKLHMVILLILVGRRCVRGILCGRVARQPVRAPFLRLRPARILCEIMVAGEQATTGSWTKQEVCCAREGECCRKWFRGTGDRAERGRLVCAMTRAGRVAGLSAKCRTEVQRLTLGDESWTRQTRGMLYWRCNAAIDGDSMWPC